VKFAGIAKTVLLAIVGVALLAPAASGATDGVTPLVLKLNKRTDAAFSGTDLIYVSDRKIKPIPRSGYESETSLVRASFLNGSKTLIKRFDPKDTAVGFPDLILAGGGLVYANMWGDGPDPNSVQTATSVLRMATDGSGAQTIASGLISSGEEDSILVSGHKAEMNDCGTSVEARFVTADGSVVIRETTSERSSKNCGRKKNVDHDRVYLLTPSGVTREILTEDSKVHLKVKFHKGGGWDAETDYDKPNTEVVSVVGDKALLVRGRRQSFYVRDLSTRVETGPYKSTLAATRAFSTASMDPLGRIALSTFAASGKSKDAKFKHATGLFETPGDPASWKAAKGLQFVNFCGSHLLSDSAKGTRELDPVTLAPLRTIVPPSQSTTAITFQMGCTNDYLYLESLAEKKKTAIYFAYPLN
jgi:hypothetical protein